MGTSARGRGFEEKEGKAVLELQKCCQEKINEVKVFELFTKHLKELNAHYRTTPTSGPLESHISAMEIITPALAKLSDTNLGYMNLARKNDSDGNKFMSALEEGLKLISIEMYDFLNTLPSVKSVAERELFLLVEKYVDFLFARKSPFKSKTLQTAMFLIPSKDLKMWKDWLTTYLQFEIKKFDEQPSSTARVLGLPTPTSTSSSASSSLSPSSPSSLPASLQSSSTTPTLTTDTSASSSIKTDASSSLPSSSLPLVSTDQPELTRKGLGRSA